MKSKNLKNFELKLKNENIIFTKEKNDDWYNYRFYERNIEIIKYYILYFITNLQLKK